MEIKIGRKYIVKSWEEMAEEFLAFDTEIRTPALFVLSMKGYCGTIVTIDEHTHCDFWHVKEDGHEFYWDEHMLKPYEGKECINYYLERRKKID